MIIFTGFAKSPENRPLRLSDILPCAGCLLRIAASPGSTNVAYSWTSVLRLSSAKFKLFLILSWCLVCSLSFSYWVDKQAIGVWGYIKYVKLVSSNVFQTVLLCNLKIKIMINEIKMKRLICCSASCFPETPWRHFPIPMSFPSPSTRWEWDDYEHDDLQMIEEYPNMTPLLFLDFYQKLFFKMALHHLHC